MKVDKWVNKLLETSGGKNRYGENMYRIVWSEETFKWAYEKQIKKYGEGKCRWILEKWMAPETYDKVSWEAATEIINNTVVSVLGPFPERGDYEHVYTFEGFEGQYCPVESGIVDVLVRCIEAGKMLTPGERIAALKARKDKEQADFDALFKDVWDDARPAPGAKLPDHIERMTSFDIQRQFDALPKLPDGFSQISEDEAKKIN